MKILFSISGLACFSFGSIQIINAMNQSPPEVAIDGKTSSSMVEVEIAVLKAAEEVEAIAVSLERTAKAMQKAAEKAEADAQANKAINIAEAVNAVEAAKRAVVDAKAATKRSVTDTAKRRAISALVIAVAYAEQIESAANNILEIAIKKTNETLAEAIVISNATVYGITKLETEENRIIKQKLIVAVEYDQIALTRICLCLEAIEKAVTGANNTEKAAEAAKKAAVALIDLAKKVKTIEEKAATVAASNEVATKTMQIAKYAIQTGLAAEEKLKQI